MFQHVSKIKFSLLSLALLLFAGASGQSIQVLPGNGKYSPTAAPQGAVRAQRQFYLIDSLEMSRAGIASATVLKSIGFTVAAAQNKGTEGKFRVFLQNTSDRVSRVDTGWTIVTTTSNKLSLSDLNGGNYEWQVRTKCATTSPFTPSNFFEVNRDICKAPTRLVTTNITGSTATLEWTKPATPVDSFKVEYARIDSVSWTTIYTKYSNYEVTGLIPGQSYQWKVASSCSNADPREMAIFTTTPSGTCGAATALAVGVVADSSASVSWSAVSGSIQYELRYRRLGSSTWDYESSLTTSAKLLRLVPGTKYEWQVRGICSATDKGFFAAGASFATTGTLRCYFPEKLYIDSLAGSSAKLSWDTAMDATSYEVRYRQLETISWAGAVKDMTEVHKDSITIPDTIGAFHVPFEGGSAFTYDGKGLYVAFEYMNDSSFLSTPNMALVNYSDRSYKNVNGEDSARMIVSLGGTTTDSLPKKLTALTYRPETWFGSPSLSDSAAVLAIYAMGQNAIPYGNPTKISALIRNYQDTAKTYAVTLTIKDEGNAAIHTETVNLTVKKDTVSLVNFTDWSPSVNGQYAIIVSLPATIGENILNNNSRTYLQTVNNSILAYADSSDAISFTGTDTLSGLTLARFNMAACGAVNAVQVYLGATAVGKSVYAVVVDGSGKILGSSTALVPDSSHVNRYNSFYFSAAVSIPNGSDFYIGIAQPKTAGGFAPVGVQWEGGYTRKGAYYIANLDGSGLKDSLAAGRLMIRAEVIPGALSPTITGDLVLCSGKTNTLSAAGITRRFANEVLSVSSQGANDQFTANQALGVPTVYPAYGFNTTAWMPASAGREYIVLKFPNADFINYIDIYQTLNPGAIDTVYIKNSTSGLFESVYIGSSRAEDTASQIKRISLTSLTTFKVDEVRIALDGAASGGNNAIDAVSIGRLSASTFSSYAWSKKTASGTSALGTSSTLSANAAGDYTLTVTNSEGCIASYTATVTSPDKTPPVITARGPLTFCIGDSVTLYSNKKAGIKWSTGATSESITVKDGGRYSFIYNDGTGCGNLESDTLSVIVNAFPEIEITGTLGICPGASTTLTAVPKGTASYSYLWSNGGTTPDNIVGSAGMQSVTATDAAGCAMTVSKVTFLTAKPQPKINGKLNFCPGESTILNAGSGFASYAWSNASTENKLTVNSVGKYHVTVTDTFGCTGSDTALVGQFVAPMPTITGNRSICGDPTTLNAGGGYVAYLWSNGEKRQTVLIATAGVAQVTVTDYNGCTGSASATTIKSTLPPRPGIITSAEATRCGALSNTYSIASIPEATHYVWFAPKGSTIVNGQGSTKVTLAFAPGFVSGDLIVAASNACGQSGSYLPRVFSINAKPNTPGAITGATTGVCSGPQKYSIAEVAGATSYLWKVPAGVNITGGQNSTEITVTFSPTFVSGNIFVKSVNDCGSSAERSLAIKGVPNTPEAIAGLTSNVCSAPQTYSISDVTGAKTYQWRVPTGATITSGQGTKSIKVTFTAPFVSGKIYVKAVNVCGSSLEKSIDIKGVPEKINSITGPTTACYKQTGVKFSVAVVPGATSYTWTVPERATFTGQGSSSITVKFATASGNVTVKANNSCGSTAIVSKAVAVTNCANTSTVLTAGEMEDIAVHQQVERDVISSAGNVSKTSTMQLDWTLGEPCIESLSSSKRMYTQGFHQPLVIAAKEIIVKGSALKIIAAPNPVSTKLRVSFEGEKEESVILNVRDAAGKIIFTKNVLTTDKGIEINMSSFSQGLYILSVHNQQGLLLENFKVIKMN